jgi:hypothetical protein
MRQFTNPKWWLLCLVAIAALAVVVLRASLSTSEHGRVARFSDSELNLIECAIGELSHEIKLDAAAIRANYVIRIGRHDGRKVITFTNEAREDGLYDTSVTYYVLAEGGRCRYLGLISRG